MDRRIGRLDFWHLRACCPLDEALELSPDVKQDDVQSVGVFLATELPYELASETCQRCTGTRFSDRSLHKSVNRVAEGLDVLDVCPNKAEAEERIARIAAGKRWRPVMMMTVHGAQEPVRPEPSPRKGKRGKGDWKEVNGFRLYLLDEDRIEHLVSWHQMGSNQELAAALKTIKEERTGAWWYPSCANNILKLRCAKYNGTYDRFMQLYRRGHPITAVRRSKKRDKSEAHAPS